MTRKLIPADVLKAIENVCDIADESLTSKNQWYPDVRFVRQWLHQQWSEEK